ncbi:uncharacterized protein LOC108327280 [Vigna angularis]|uniref:uncharacterized protein LOC108327280 n=1 Tax=Phaseolus angularis TaxID=3914 RepID=UPI00080A3938|nr:uncharacterized protein LOC108327280 [Vigna angularis]
MKLRSDFEGIRPNFMHRDPVPSLDACLNDLLREVQRLLTQSIIEEQRLSTVLVAYVAQGKSRRHDMSTIQCFSCKRFGHYASTYPKKFYKYCKKDGHIIKECPIRPPRRPATTFTTTTDSSIPNSYANSTPVHQNATTDVSTLTPEMDQHSGKIIVKGPKVGHLFPINFSLSPSLSLPLVSCNSAIVDYQVWHKRLGHPNSNAQFSSKIKILRSDNGGIYITLISGILAIQ